MYRCAAALWFCSDLALFNNVSTVPVFGTGTVPVPNCINFNEFLREIFIYFYFHLRRSRTFELAPAP